MNDSEFIELLNLYLDHEIGPKDAERLEAEVTTNAARRRVYQEYCQMYKACSLLADRFEESSPEAPRVARPEPRRAGWGMAIYSTGLLAAACVAVVVVGRLRMGGAAATPALAAAPAPAAHAVVMPELAAAPLNDELKPVMLLSSLSLKPTYAAPRPVEVTAGSADQFAWIKDVRFTPIPPVAMPSLSLKPGAGSSPAGPALTTEPAEASQPVENVAFKFQR